VPKQRGVTNEEARPDPRRRLLNAGADLMVEDAQRNPFAALRLRTLCARAGLSSGAFYVHWEDLDSYYTDLGHHLVVGDGDLYVGDFTQLQRTIDELDGLPLLEAVLRLADFDLQLLLANREWDASSLFTLTWGRNRHREESAEGYRQVDGHIADVYGNLLARHGRRARPPLTLDQVATTLQSLIEGSAQRHRIDPDAISPSGGSPSSYAIGVAGLLAVLTSRDDDDTDLMTVLGQLLAGNASPDRTPTRRPATPRARRAVQKASVAGRDVAR